MERADRSGWEPASGLVTTTMEITIRASDMAMECIIMRMAMCMKAAGSEARERARACSSRRVAMNTKAIGNRMWSMV